MRFGMFMQPAHPPSRGLAEAIEQNLTTIEWLDELGYDEVWHGEHLVHPYEPVPACDLVLARAMERTERIMLCTGGYVLSNYHPAALALRIAQMDQMLKGRFICGVAAGGTPTDVPLMSGSHDIGAGMAANREMLQESLHIMKLIWTDHLEGDWTYQGKFWSVANPKRMLDVLGPHIEPYHKPFPPMAIAGTSPYSETIRFAGAEGMIPMSFSFNAEFIKTHWQSMEEGAASTGRTASRSDWRIAREIFVGDSDADAKDWVLNGEMGTHWNEFNMPFIREYNFLKYLKNDPSIPDDRIDLEFMVDNVWPIGGPERVLERLKAEYIETGGFGTLLMVKYDWGNDSARYRRSLELFINEVAPAFNVWQRKYDAETAAIPAGVS